jgi:TolB-like protein/DNA-binding winged helix-turn-helix (wHTH) protein/Tfp pilus assembly protein PilF
MVTRTRHIYEFGPFRLIPEERQLLRDEQSVSLTPKSFELLVVLVENSGHLIEKGELMKRIWPDSFVEEANLSVTMSVLRRALGEGPNEHQYVETVPRRGYRFVAAVKERWDEGTQLSSKGSSEDNGSKRVADVKQPTLSQAPATVSPAWLSFGRWPLFVVGLLALSVLLVGLNAGGLRERLRGKINPVQVQSLAVLPLENLSRDNSQDYFADGMTEALITDLAKISAIRVMSRSSVMQYKSARKPPPEIGRELNVDAVLTGSVARSAERVRVTVQLVHVATDRNLWTKSYERDLRDVPALQKEVAQDIVREVGIKLRPQEQLQTGGVRSINPAAYDLYLRGRFYLNRQNKDDNEAAITALERAVATDPTFASAYAELAQAYVWKLFLFAPAERQWEEKAFVAAEKALAFDPDSAVAHLARGRILWTPANHFPHEKAIREYHRALTLDPTLDEAQNQLALVYCHIGAFDQALKESHEAAMKNPNNNLAQLRTGQTLNFQGKHEEALTVLRAIPQEANPALVGHQIAWALFNLGRRDEASAMLEQLLSDHPEDSGGVFTSVQAVLAASAGHERTAQDKIKLAVEKGKGFGHFHHTAYHIACAYALMNKPEQAIKWLEVAAEDGFPCYPLFERDTNLDNIRKDARFLTFMAKQRQQWDYYKTIL